jgi:hypothetical protein
MLPASVISCFRFTVPVRAPQKHQERAHVNPDKEREKNYPMLRKILDFLFDSVYQIVTWVWIGVSIASFFFFAGKPSGQRAQGMKWSAISLGLSVITMILLLAKQHFFDAAPPDERPKEGAPNLPTTPCPEMYIASAKINPFVPGQPERFMLLLKNSGDLAARKITIKVATTVRLKFLTGPLDERYVEQGDMVAKMVPGQEMTLVAQSNSVVTPEHITDVEDGRRLLFHHGIGTYSDELGRDYSFRFVFMYDHSLSPHMRVAPPKYWPKDEDSG